MCSLDFLQPSLVPGAVVPPVLCSCGTLLPPVRITHPVTGETREIQAWVKACPTCLERREREAGNSPSPCNGRGGRGVRVKERHDYWDEYFDR